MLNKGITKELMEIIQRYSNPTKYDLAPYGTICKNNDNIFIQISKDPEASNWLYIGDFFQIIYQKSILSDDFIKKCLDIYEKLNV